jgi:hypothetical protein
MVRIVLCDPVHYRPDMKPHATIPDALAAKIRKQTRGTRLVREVSPDGSYLVVSCAYIFGDDAIATDPSRIAEYELITDHDNDSANTALIDLDCKVKPRQQARVVVEKDLNPDDPDDVARGKALSPHLLWWGETPGGDVGASLLGRRGPDGEFDSLIVNVYFFDDDKVEGKSAPPPKRARASAEFE